MTNEEFLADKFCMSKYATMQDLLADEASYLLQQMQWMEKNFVKILSDGTRTALVCYPFARGSFQATGSCLLEAIENAQKEMGDD